MSRQKHNRQGVIRQSGAAVLTVTVILLVIATIATLMIGRVGLQEQKIVGTDVRSKEVYSAAIGGLEFGVDWLEDNHSDLLWTDITGDGNACIDDTLTNASPAPTLDNVTLNADSYSHTITYTLKSCWNSAVGELPTVVEVSSTATAAADSHISKTVRVDVMLGKIDAFAPSVFDSDTGVFDGPPIIVENCMYGINGNPDVYPNGGIAVGTTQGNTGCLDEGHLNLNGGSKLALAPSASLWDAVFGADVTEADLRTLEEKDPSRVFIVDSGYPRYPADQPDWNGNNWHNSLGSADSPVILYFDSSMGCPNINGSPTIYGLVYYEVAYDENGDPLCSYNGWGGADIYGTVAVSGDITGFNANGEIWGESLDFGGTNGGGGTGGPGTGLPSVDKLSEIPGTWRDF